MPDPPLAAAPLPPAAVEPFPLLAAATTHGPAGPWANDLMPAVLLLALGAGLVALGAWIVRPDPKPPPRPHRRHGGPRPQRRRRNRGGRPPGDASRTYPAPPPPDPVRRPLRLP